MKKSVSWSDSVCNELMCTLLWLLIYLQSRNIQFSSRISLWVSKGVLKISSRMVGSDVYYKGPIRWDRNFFVCLFCNTPAESRGCVWNFGVRQSRFQTLVGGVGGWRGSMPWRSRRNVPFSLIYILKIPHKNSECSVLLKKLQQLVGQTVELVGGAGSSCT